MVATLQDVTQPRALSRESSAFGIQFLFEAEAGLDAAVMDGVRVYSVHNVFKMEYLQCIVCSMNTNLQIEISLYTIQE